MSSKTKPLPSALPIEVFSLIHIEVFVNIKQRTGWSGSTVRWLVLTSTRMLCWRSPCLLLRCLLSTNSPTVKIFTSKNFALRVIHLKQWLQQSQSSSPPRKMCWTIWTLGTPSYVSLDTRDSSESFIKGVSSSMASQGWPKPAWKVRSAWKKPRTWWWRWTDDSPLTSVTSSLKSLI